MRSPKAPQLFCVWAYQQSINVFQENSSEFFETMPTVKPPGLSKIDEEHYFQPRVLISYSFISLFSVRQLPTHKVEICWVLRTHKWHFPKISLKSLSHPCEKSNFQTISHKHNPNICKIYIFRRVWKENCSRTKNNEFGVTTQVAISIKKISPFHSHLSRAISITLLLITHSTNLPCLVCMFDESGKDEKIIQFAQGNVYAN